MTVRDLLTHTSGVVSGTISNFANRAVAAGPRETLADYIPRLGQVPLEFQPGTRWAYMGLSTLELLAGDPQGCLATNARGDLFVANRPGYSDLAIDVTFEGDEMVTFFNIQGAMIYLDKNDRVIGSDDVFTKIEMCRSHYASVGLAGYEEQFIR